MGHADARSVQDSATTVLNSCSMTQTVLRKEGGSTLKRGLAWAWDITMMQSWGCAIALLGAFSSVLSMATHPAHLKIRGASEFEGVRLRKQVYLAIGLTLVVTQPEYS
jgi:hypothetical protein